MNKAAHWTICIVIKEKEAWRTVAAWDLNQPCGEALWLRKTCSAQTATHDEQQGGEESRVVFVPTRLLDVERDKLQVAVLIWLDQTGDAFEPRRARCKRRWTSDTKLCICVYLYPMNIPSRHWKYMIGQRKEVLHTGSPPCVCDAADDTNNDSTCSFCFTSTSAPSPSIPPKFI